MLPLTTTAEEEAEQPFEFQETESFPKLESFDAFEEHVSRYTQTCFDAWAGSSMGAHCSVRSELWDRELNIAYKRLMAALEADGKEKLRGSQRRWIEFRDTTIEFSRYVLDRHFDLDGTMWRASRASSGDTVVAKITKARTLQLSQWHQMVTEPLSKDLP